MLREMRIRNYSERTVHSYITSISQLAKYYKISPDKISREQVKSFAYYLIRHKQVSTPTINQLISAWKIFQVDTLEKAPLGLPMENRNMPFLFVLDKKP